MLLLNLGLPGNSNGIQNTSSTQEQHENNRLLPGGAPRNTNNRSGSTQNSTASNNDTSSKKDNVDQHTSKTLPPTQKSNTNSSKKLPQAAKPENKQQTTDSELMKGKRASAQVAKPLYTGNQQQHQQHPTTTTQVQLPNRNQQKQTLPPTKQQRHEDLDDSDDETSSISSITTSSSTLSQSTAMAPLPSYIQQIVRIYCVIHILRQQMEDSVQHCEEQWESLLFCSSSVDVVCGEEAFIELCKDVSPALGLKLQEMNKLMNEMIHVENEALNLLEEVEESLAVLIKKTNWYKSNPGEFKRYLKKYCSQLQLSMKQERAKDQLQKDLKFVEEEEEERSSATLVEDIAGSTLKKSKKRTSPKKKEKSDKVSNILKQGAFSLDSRSNRLHDVFKALAELKQDETNKALFNKHVTIKTTGGNAQQLKAEHRIPGKRPQPQPVDELDNLLSRLNELQQQHDTVMRRIALLKRPVTPSLLEEIHKTTPPVPPASSQILVEASE